MPVWIAALLGGLLSILGSLVGRILVALGIGYVAYTGLDLLIGAIKDQVIAQFGAMPAQAILIAHVLRIDSIINVWLSAATAKLTIAGITSGKLTRMVIK